MLLIGGSGFAVSAVTVFAMPGVSERDAGVASGPFNTTQQVGGALAAALVITLAVLRQRQPQPVVKGLVSESSA